MLVTTVAAARAIEADAELNTYFHSLKTTSPEAKLFALMEQYDDISNRVEAAHARFVAEPREAGPQLRTALLEVRGLAKKQRS